MKFVGWYSGEDDLLIVEDQWSVEVVNQFLITIELAGLNDFLLEIIIIEPMTTVER
jgi:hypothetical protein